MALKEKYDSIDLTAVQDYVTNRELETVHLDFKATSASRMNREDRKLLAKSISGFANGGGGLIVWGVDARKNVDGIDCADSLKPYVNIKQFVANLNEYSSDATDPSVDGVEHKEIQESGASGYAVTLVPASDRTPHMAKNGEHRYYKRNGDSFRIMEHFDVSDMFGRRAFPKLKIIAYSSIEGSRDTPILKVIVCVTNRGRGIARNCWLQLFGSALSPDTYGLDGSFNQGWQQAPSRQGPSHLCFHTGQSLSIPPGIESPVAKLSTGMRGKKSKSFSLNYIIAAEGIPSAKGALEMRYEDGEFQSDSYTGTP